MPTEPARTVRLRCEPLEDRLTPSFAPLPTTGTPLLYFFVSDTPFPEPFGGAGVTESPAGATVGVRVERAGDPGTPVAVTVNVGVGGAPSGRVAPGAYTVAFAAGQTSAYLDLPVANDTVIEPPERVTFTLSNPTGGAALLGGGGPLTRVVLDDDEAALVLTSVPPAAPFGGGSTTVGVTGANPAVAVPAERPTQFVPFAGYRGAVFVARGDASGDGVADVFAGAAVSGHVKVLDGATGAELRSFLAYAGYTGAVRVAAADVNGDGFADVVTAAEVNGHVKSFDGRTGAELRSFFAAPGFAGPLDLAARSPGVTPGVVDPVVVTGAAGLVRAVDMLAGANFGFLGRSDAEVPFSPYAGYGGPVFVAAADVTGDGVADLITGAPNGHLKVFDGSNGNLRVSFLDPRGSIVDVAAADADGDGLADIIAGEGGVPSAYSGRTGARLDGTGFPFDRLNTNAVHVG